MTHTDGPVMLEARIHEIGTQLFAAAAEKGDPPRLSSLFGGRAMQRRALERAAEDPDFRARLFRFIDVYPSLRDSGDLVRHLRGYLQDRGELPSPLDRVLGPDGDRRVPSWLIARLTERTMQRLAKGLIAGNNNDTVFSELKRLRRAHTGFCLDVLSEACLSEAEAADYTRRCLDALAGLPPKVSRWAHDPVLDEAPWGEVPRMDLVVRLSSLHSQTDVAAFESSRRTLVATLKPIALKARQVGASLGIALERYAHRDLAIAVFSDLVTDPELADYPHVGITVQAYLRDSAEDVQTLVDLARRRGTPITVRLVKGAYWDEEVIAARQQHRTPPVFTRKAETDAQFERLAGMLIENHEWTRAVLATHNVRSLAAGIAAAEAAGLLPRAIGLQMIHGLAEPVRRAAVSQRYRVREQVPMGDPIPGMAYIVRRLLETTANESFLRITSTRQLDPEALLAAPEVTTPEPDASVGPGDAASEATPSPVEESAIPPFQNESPAGFHLAETRADMDKALATIRASLDREYALVIGGTQVETESRITSLNPARPDEVVGIVASADIEQADAALDAAREAFPSWRDTPADRRAAALLKAAALMRERRSELAALMIVEAGKPWREADADVTEAIDFMEYYAREMLRLAPARDLSDIPGEDDLHFYEPRGVAAVIAPWNFPLAIPAGMISAALVAGNTVVFKPASATPVLGYALVRILHEAGIPEEVLSFLPGAGEEIGDYLSSDPRVDLIAFTGSLAVGRRIMQRAATISPGQRNIKRVVAELGGKNAIIVDTDADLDEAVQGVITSAFGHAGQKCSACSRVIVLEGVYEQFLRRLIPAVDALTIGDPADPATRIGPIISAPARQMILYYIEKGRQEARLVYPTEDMSARMPGPPSIPPAATMATQETAPPEQAPGATEASKATETAESDGASEEKTPDETAPTATPAPAATPGRPGHFVAPHIFVDVAPDAVIAQEEIFGPVLTVFKVRRFQEALDLAMKTHYGLTGGLYSRNPSHIRRAVKGFRVGNLYINRPITGAMVGRQPFGGSRMSGIGSKAGGPDYLLQFMEPRVVTENTVWRGFAPVFDDEPGS